MSFYRWVVGDLRTGRIAREVDFTSPRWSADIEDGGTLAASYPLDALTDQGQSVWPTAAADTAPGKSFLAVAYVTDDGTEHWKAGGPIWTHDYQDATATLTLGASALSSYYDHRKVMPVLAAGQNPATATVTYATAQLGLIAKRLVELAHSHTNGALPVVLPSDASLGGDGTSHTRTYPGYELGWVGERLQQLSDVIGGPEIQFVPRRRSSDRRFMEWVMRVGTDATGGLLTQTGPAWLFDRTTRDSPLTAINVKVDGGDLTGRAWAAGQGEAEGRPIVYVNDSKLTGSGWPLLEVEDTGNDTVSDVATLTAKAAARVAYGSAPIETWTVVAHRDGPPHVGRYSPGDWCQVRIAGHAYLPDGLHRMRIMSVAGDADHDVTLTMVPRLGVS